MINWKIRFKNPQFLIQLVLSFALPTLAYYGLEFKDLTTWGSLFSLIGNALSNPFILGTIALSIYNSTTDPTTRGFGDSQRSLGYHTPVDTKHKTK